MGWMRRAPAAVMCTAALVACTTGAPAARRTTAAATSSAASAPQTPEQSPARSDTPAEVVVRCRVEVRSTDPALAGFPADLHAILTGPRGWSRAGFTFVVDPAAAYLVVLAERREV